MQECLSVECKMQVVDAVQPNQFSSAKDTYFFLELEPPGTVPPRRLYFRGSINH